MLIIFDAVATNLVESINKSLHALQRRVLNTANCESLIKLNTPEPSLEGREAGP